MATKALNRVIQYLRRAAVRQDGGGMADSDLLECYVTRGDEAAFEALVRRHGPMVLGVCRRILRNEADAEDAFQATFLVLVRKAGKIWPRGMVSNWLFGVAQNASLKAKAMIHKRRAKEKEAGTMPKPEVAEEVWRQLQILLDEELSRLPDKYRVPIVLCELEGKTIKEAARHLGWPQGTVATRLAHGRRMLAKRLCKHGLTLSGGALAALLSQGAASASVPAPLVISTVKAASLFAAGKAATGVVSTTVAALTEGVLKTMFMTKLKIVAALALVFVAVLVGGSGVTFQTQAGGRADAPQKDQKQAALSVQILGRDDFDARSGVIESHKERQGLLILKLDKGNSYALHEKAKVLIDGKEARFQDLKAGMLVFLELTQDLNEAKLVRASWMKSRGIVASAVDVDARKFDFLARDYDVIEGKERAAIATVSVLKDAKVFIDGKDSKLADLKEKMEVVLYSRADTGEVVAIKARGGQADAKPKPPAKEKDKPKDDKDQLQGTLWTLIARESDGKRQEYPQGAGISLRFDGNKFILDTTSINPFGGHGDGTTVEHTYVINPAQKPKTIDLIVINGPKQGEAWIRGVYRLKGDELEICWGKERPTEFKTKPGSGWALSVYKRPAPLIAQKEQGRQLPARIAAEDKPEKLLKLEGPVTSALWSLDGKLMASVTTRKEKGKEGEGREFDYFTALRIHDAKTGAEKVSLGELKNANHVHRVFAPDGKTLAISIRGAISEGDKVELWDVEKGQLLQTVEMDYGRTRPAVAFSPDSKRLAVAYGGPSNKLTGGARLFDTQTGKLAQTLTGHKDLVIAVAFSPNGKMLATGGDYHDREIRLWDLTSGKAIRVLEGLQGSALSMAFSPDGKTIACGDTEGGVRLWNVETGKAAASPQDNPGHSSLVAFSRDGRLLLSAGHVEKEGKRTGEVRLWDVKTGALLLKLHNTSRSAAFSPDDRTLSVLISGQGVRHIGLAKLLKDSERFPVPE